MTAEGILYFIILIGGSLLGLGVIVEILAIRAKNPKIKYIPIAITAFLYLLTGFINGYFTGDAPALFGILTISEIAVLLVYFLIKKLGK